LQNKISAYIQEERTVVHIASHSFTPVLKNKKRLMDVGLLYDPKRQAEKQFCRLWKKHIRDASSAKQYAIRSNAPYKGVSDGIPACFRKFFGSRYLGIELELNQRWFFHHPRDWKVLCDVVLKALKATVKSLSHTG
jgi:predicted N-formylglutamate amidohydrolase